MATKSPTRARRHNLYGWGLPPDLDVESLRSRLLKRLSKPRAADPLSALPDIERRFLVCQLELARVEEQLTPKWLDVLEAIPKAKRARSFQPLDHWAPPPRPAGAPRKPDARRAAMFDAYQGGESLESVARRESVSVDHARALIRAEANARGVTVEWRERVTRTRDRRRRAEKSRA